MTQTEVLFYQLHHSSASDFFPVPKIIKYDSSIQNYYLASKLHGSPLSHSSDAMKHEEIVEIYRELGNHVGQLHANYIHKRLGYFQREHLPR